MGITFKKIRDKIDKKVEELLHKVEEVGDKFKSKLEEIENETLK